MGCSILSKIISATLEKYLMCPGKEEPHDNSQTDTKYHISSGYSEFFC